ncbi:complement control/ sushi-like repeats protein, partial [Leptotrombidium deliense]
NSGKNATSINENHIYKPPLEPSLTANEESTDKHATSYGPKLPNDQKLFCGKVPIVSNAISSMYSIKDRIIPVNTVATYNCIHGYRKVNGSEKLRCVTSRTTKTAVWETPTLKCQIVDCGDPGPVEHAKQHAFTFTFNETVFYTCDSGYLPEGLPLICTANGKWNRPKPKCKLIQCPKIEPHDTNMLIEYSNNDRVNGTIATMKCKRGFRFNETKQSYSRVCEWSGSWSRNLSPHCVRAYCDTPPKPHTGLLIKPFANRYNAGERVLLLCLTRKDKKSILCTEDGVWDDAIMHCPAPHPKSMYCPQVSDIPNGSHNGSKGKQKAGTRIVFKCNNNYLLNGTPWIYCQADGTWTGKVPSCSVKSTSVSIERTSSKLTVLWTCIAVVFVLILVIIAVLLLRWRQRQLQRRHWRRYFGNHTYRQSKTNIYHNNQEMKLFKQSKSQAVPVTDL